MEACERLRRLGEEGNWAGEVDLLDVLTALHDDRLAFGLPDEAIDLGMPLLAVDDDLSSYGIKLGELTAHLLL